jgi:Flp pilus assembly protein TadD
MEQVQHTVRELQKQTTNNPKVPERLIALGNLSFDANKHEEAVEWYPKALALDPKDVHVRTDLGTSLHNLGRFDEALKGFRRALEYGPDHPQTLFNLAVTELVGKNDFGRAEEALRRLKQLNPDFPGIAQLEARIGQLRQERSSPAGSNPRP